MLSSRTTFPLDISRSNIEAYCKMFNKPGFVADATELPFEDASTDCIFTHAFLEHTLVPEKVLEEIARVLAPGGIVIHNDAWFCRWWQKYGIVGLKRFTSMNTNEKIIYIISRVTELSVLRIPPIIIKRLWRMIFCRNNKSLSYSKLAPDYELFLGCDEDAACSIDPVEVIRFYEARGFKTLKKLTFFERLKHRNAYIAMTKP